MTRIVNDTHTRRRINRGLIERLSNWLGIKKGCYPSQMLQSVMQTKCCIAYGEYVNKIISDPGGTDNNIPSSNNNKKPN